jgi:mannose-6-phosphate isomerase-like protein (cupin superfamily)
MLKGKIWGNTTLLLMTPFVELHRLFILPNRECSLHCHQFKWNAFWVLSGVLSIEVHKNDYQLVDVTSLSPGDFTTVKPGEYHKFISHGAPVEAFELYYPEPLSEDIIRKSVGGVTQ